MAKKNGASPAVEVVVEEQKTPNVWVDNAHKVLLVGLGAVGMSQDTLKDAQDEVSKFFNKLVERGETVEKDSRKFFSDAIEQRKKQTEEFTDKAESELDKRIEEVLHRMSIPTKADINELVNKINLLSRKIDELKKVTA